VISTESVTGVVFCSADSPLTADPTFESIGLLDGIKLPHYSFDHKSSERIIPDP
jgi:hypothetical protein